MSESKILYRKFDEDKVGYSDEYINHVSAMTSETLHSKAEIALELAGRDLIINELCDLLEEARKKVGLVMIYPENDGNNPIELREIIDEAVAKARDEHVSK